MAEPEAPELEVSKQRSPAYPYISLDLAVDRAKKLFERLRDTAQPREVMAQAYGKPVTSSATIQTFATLTQYGLLEVVNSNGQRRLRVSSVVRTLSNPNAPVETVQDILKDLALRPSIFRELWARYGTTIGLHDGAILYYLTHDREREHGSVFTDRAAQEVLRVYRGTITYAGLTEPDNILEEEEEDEVGTIDETLKAPSTESESTKSAPIPPDPLPQQRERRLPMSDQERELQTGMLSKTASYRVVVSGHVGVKEIERLIRKLEMDKEILADEEANNSGADDIFS